MGHLLNSSGKTALTLAATATIFLSGCTGGSGADQQQDSTSTPSFQATAGPDDITPHEVGTTINFECADPIDTASDIADLNVSNPITVPDVMALYASDDSSSTIQWGGAHYRGLTFAKVALIVKVGATITLKVPDQMREHVKIGWSNSGYTVADSIAILGCTSNVPDAKWLVYPGGFWLDAPACVPLTVTHGKDTETIHVPIGTSCS